MVKIACIMLTLNEQPRIENSLKWVSPYVDYFLVIDGESTDGTIEEAKRYADNVIIRRFSGSFAEEKNYARTLVPTDHRWILWIDADEIWDVGFLKSMRRLIENAEKRGATAYRFPRINLPNPEKSFPDYQTRLFQNSKDILWKEKVHEVPWLITENIPLDQADNKKRKAIIPISTMDDYPIIHLPRRKDLQRPWW